MVNISNLQGKDRSVAKAAFTYIFGAITPIFLFTYCGQLFVNEVSDISGFLAYASLISLLV